MLELGIADILYSVARVENVLAKTPALATALASTLKPPDKLGCPSKAFPTSLRITDREIYRVLANTQYEHLAELAFSIEKTYAAGCEFGDVLKTRSHAQFLGHAAEVLLAESLLDRGYQVATVPLIGSASCDLHVTGRGVDMAIEVYSVREFVGLKEWVDDLRDVFNHADVPASFRSDAQTRVSDSAPTDKIHRADELATMIKKSGPAVLDEIDTDIAAAAATMTPFTKTYPHAGTDLETVVTVDQVTAAPPEGPWRNGHIGSFGPSGYAPEELFKKFARNAREKAKLGQAQASTAKTRALLVNLAYSDIAEDLIRPPYSKYAEEIVAGEDPTKLGLDLLAFTVPAKPKGVAAAWAIFEDETVSPEQVKEMFWSTSQASGV